MHNLNHNDRANLMGVLSKGEMSTSLLMGWRGIGVITSPSLLT